MRNRSGEREAPWRGAGGGIQEDKKAGDVVGALTNYLMQFYTCIRFIVVLKTP